MIYVVTFFWYVLTVALAYLLPDTGIQFFVGALNCIALSVLTTLSVLSFTRKRGWVK